MFRVLNFRSDRLRTKKKQNLDPTNISRYKVYGIVHSNSAYLLEVVEAVYNRGLRGWQLRKHIQQLYYHLLLVVNDGQVQGTVRGRGYT